MKIIRLEDVYPSKMKDAVVVESVSERHEYSKELAENSYEEPTIIEEMKNSDSLDVHKDQNGDFYISLS